MHHKKHHKRNNPWIPVLVMVLLFFLVGFEIYLLFFSTHSDPISKSDSNKTPQATLALTKDAQQAKNFNQEVQPTSDLAEQMNQTLKDNQFIGTALVIQNGQIILQKGFGYANFSKKKENTYQSLFQIGSIQKALTAALIFQQVQAQNLSLDETLDRFYPTIPDSKKITIRQLLSMNSGLYQKVKPENMMSEDAFLQFEISNAAMGTYGRFRYEAVNYYILVGILEQLTGSSYRTLFNQTYIQKLRLMHTYFYSDFLNSKDRTFAYQKTDGKNYGTEIPDKPLLFKREIGTGNIGMTVGDLYLFFSHFLSGTFFDEQTRDLVWPPETQDKYMGGIYNFGNYIRSHGIEEGFETNIYISKDSQNAVILFTNQYPKSQVSSLLSKSLFDLLGPYKKK